MIHRTEVVLIDDWNTFGKYQVRKECNGNVSTAGFRRCQRAAEQRERLLWRTRQISHELGPLALQQHYKFFMRMRNAVFA
jgi:hypothetical protein